MDFINFFGYKKTGLKIQTGFPYPFPTLLLGIVSPFQPDSSPGKSRTERCENQIISLCVTDFPIRTGTMESLQKWYFRISGYSP